MVLSKKLRFQDVSMLVVDYHAVKRSDETTWPESNYTMYMPEDIQEGHSQER
jgi:predicted peptidase